MMFNRQQFFQVFREKFGEINQNQADGLNFLLGKIEADIRWTDISPIAYFLATIYHETSHTFKPIKELRGRPGTKIRAIQDRYWNTGYYGRGYVQITWKKNYEIFGIADTPEKALDPDTAYEIAAKGMIDGLFTGKKISEFCVVGKKDYVNARTVINGHDRATMIAGYAVNFEIALSASLEIQATPNPIIEPDKQTVETLSLFQQARSGYNGASESEKSLVARVLQFGWVALTGLLAYVNQHPVTIAVIVGFAVLGYIVFHQYAKRQDMKTKLKGT
jgi:putative chitinase